MSTDRHWLVCAYHFVFKWQNISSILDEKGLYFLSKVMFAFRVREEMEIWSSVMIFMQELL